MERLQKKCKACSFAKFGIKTRKSIPHTCNKIPVIIDGELKHVNSTTEEYENVLQRLIRLLKKEEDG